MKATRVLCFCTLFLIKLTGCNVDNSTVVESEKQTLECIQGNWIPENADSTLAQLRFLAPNETGEKSGTMTTTVGAKVLTGTWHYKTEREIELSNVGDNAHFELLSCNRGILNNLTIYHKQQ